MALMGENHENNKNIKTLLLCMKVASSAKFVFIPYFTYLNKKRKKKVIQTSKQEPSNAHFPSYWTNKCNFAKSMHCSKYMDWRGNTAR